MLSLGTGGFSIELLAALTIKPFSGFERSVEEGNFLVSSSPWKLWFDLVLFLDSFAWRRVEEPAFPFPAIERRGLGTFLAEAGFYWLLLGFLYYNP